MAEASDLETDVRHRGLSKSFDDALAQGRAEILDLVAAIDPLYALNANAPEDTCFFCGCDGRHAEDCLWVRAQQAASEER